MKKIILTFSLILSLYTSNSFAMLGFISRLIGKATTKEVHNPVLLQAIHDYDCLGSLTFALQHHLSVQQRSAERRRLKTEIRQHLSTEIDKVIKSNKNPAQITVAGKPLLHYIVYFNSAEDLQKLVDFGADLSVVDSNGKTALQHIGYSPMKQDKEYIFETHCPKEYLIYRTRKLMSSIGANPSLNDDEMQWIKSDNVAIHDDLFIGSLLFRAITFPNKDFIEALLNNLNLNPNISFFDQTVLNIALDIHKDLARTEYQLYPRMFKKGDIKIREEIVWLIVDHPRMKNKKEDLLRVRKILPPRSDLLFEGIREGNRKKITKAMEWHTNINAQQENGDTPMHVAVKSGNPEIIKYLLLFRPDLTIKNNQGKTAIQLAIESHNSGEQILQNIFLKAAFAPKDSIFSRLFKLITTPFHYFAGKKDTSILAKLGTLRNYFPITKLICWIPFRR